MADFLMHENLRFAKDSGYEWLDVMPTCGNIGLRRFKEKWFAEPNYRRCIQTLSIGA